METIVTSTDVSTIANDFSMFSLFIRADLIVKSVIIILIASSIWSWSIIVSKFVNLKKLRQLENEFDEIFWSGNSFEDLYETFSINQNDPKSRIFCSAMDEWKKSKKTRSQVSTDFINSLKERMHRSMMITYNKETELIEKHLSFLATAGSTAPFVGLFGTVWGIMNSFQSIAIAQDTNLAVVAPGIAEALFATALGLFVAIPSVVAYNQISSHINKFSSSLEDFTNEFTTIFFRQLEQA